MNETVAFDPLSPEFAENPYRTYRALRETDKPHYFAAQDMWLLSRYEDIKAVATNPKLVRSLEGLESAAEARERQRRANWHDMPYHERFVQFSLLDSDGPVHRRLRKLVFGAFTPDALSHLERHIEAFVQSRLNQLSDRDEVEFIEDFAAAIPGYVIGRLLGVDEADCPQLRVWSEQVVQFFDVDRSDERKEIAETATREFHQFLSDLRAERRQAPRDDLISRMIEDERNGHYSDDEFISTCMLILMAGHGSTIDVLGTGMHTLLTHPTTLEHLRPDPTALPGAIDEMFRFESPLPFFHRHALEDTAIRDHDFPAGTTFGLLYGAGNRDPAVFSDADQFDITRRPNRHLGFGMGAHLCLGNNLAKLNMRVIFAALLKRFSRIELVDETVLYKRGLSVRGVEALRIAWHAC